MQILNVSPERLMDVKCKINPEKSSTIKVSENILSGFQRHLKAQKTSMIYTEVKIVLKSFVNL